MGEGMDGRLAGEAVRGQLAQTLLDTIGAIWPTADGLVAHYPLNGDAQAQEASLNGTVQGATSAPGPWGTAQQALRFAGSPSSYVTLPAVDVLKPTHALTLSIWVRPSLSTIQEQYIIFTKNTATADQQAYALSIHNNKFRAYKNTSNTPNTFVESQALQINVWHHVVVVMDEAGIRQYVNGTLQGGTTLAHGFEYEAGAAVVLGGTNESGVEFPFVGDLSALRLYNRALNLTEIMQLYHNGQPLPALANLSSVTTLQPADYIYHYLINEVPEHWIPFVPVRLPSSNELVLQRGKMLRNMPFLPENLQHIYPAGTLLREHTHSPGLYFLKEEEVPRAGVEVRRSFQRARWLNGKVFTWLGRQKRAGYGEVESQLQFDTLEPREKV